MSDQAQISVSLSTWKAIEAARQSLNEDHDAILARLLASKAKPRAADASPRHAPPPQRRRGNVSVDLFGRIEPVANLKAGYLAILSALVRHKPSLFELLATEGTTRRRWAARSGADLYPGSPHLARDFAHRILPEWFVDTNLSRAQIAARLTLAARLAGYRFGEDVKLIEG